MVDVLLAPSAQKEFDALPPIIKERMRTLFRRLANWPNVSGARPLTGKLAGAYRLRTGDYRLRFHLRGEVVIVDRIGHRKDAYDD
jgi:mRNA interferase RelE/StbE